jgi:hypothetical protein
LVPFLRLLFLPQALARPMEITKPCLLLHKPGRLRHQSCLLQLHQVVSQLDLPQARLAMAGPKVSCRQDLIRSLQDFLSPTSCQLGLLHHQDSAVRKLGPCHQHRSCLLAVSLDMVFENKKWTCKEQPPRNITSAPPRHFEGNQNEKLRLDLGSNGGSFAPWRRILNTTPRSFDRPTIFTTPDHSGPQHTPTTMAENLPMLQCPRTAQSFFSMLASSTGKHEVSLERESHRGGF